VELANDVNEHMPDYVVRRVTLALNRRRRAVNGARIVQVGLAYKRNTADARESPAVHVAQRLLALGADLRVVDPLVGDQHEGVAAPFIAGTPEEFAEADLVLVLTDHDVVDWDAVSRAPHVFDTRHRLEGANVEHL
jgi:UDP-N-acetyl-D-mannosaminuronate dehydrogenase